MREVVQPHVSADEVLAIIQEVMQHIHDVGGAYSMWCCGVTGNVEAELVRRNVIAHAFEVQLYDTLLAQSVLAVFQNLGCQVVRIDCVNGTRFFIYRQSMQTRY